jgi:hypothetical protein
MLHGMMLDTPCQIILQHLFKGFIDCILLGVYVCPNSGSTFYLMN